MNTAFRKLVIESFKSGYYLSFFLIIVIITSGCGMNELLLAPSSSSQPEVKLLAAPENPAAGVIRYCWEEPMVDFEENGPGLDSDGHWYVPSHVAVREVRAGRWRPCEEIKSESLGDENNAL